MLVYSFLKHTTALFSLSDHYILSPEWKVFVDQVHTNKIMMVGYGAVISHSGVTELMRDPH